MYWRITSTVVPATGTFISIDKFTKFCSRLRTEHYMHKINVMIPFFQHSPIPWSNMFPYPLCSFWNWIINDFSSISHYHDQMIVHQIYWMHIMIYFSFSTDSIIPWIALLNKCSLFNLTQFISHLQRKENSCYIILNYIIFSLFYNIKIVFSIILHVFLHLGYIFCMIIIIAIFSLFFNEFWKHNRIKR